MTRPVTTIALLALSGVAAHLAEWVGLPLPFLIGPLLASAAVATALPHRLPAGYAFPPTLRLVFIAVIGLMIGAQVTPELFSNAPRLALSFAALLLFTVLAHAIGYAVYARIGGYDRVTAFYAAAPGGLFESIAMGDEAGADPARLMLQQFLRVIVVVTLLPIGLSIWLGEPVGSSAGLTLARADVPWQALPVIVLAGAAGIGAGHVLRLPARQFTGPLAVAAALNLTGVWHIDIPEWLLHVAQVVVGCALGMRFTGLSRAMLLRGFGLTILSVGGILILSGLFAVALMGPIGQPFDVMLISFAPGGVTEMALVALSLQANPALVTLHHIFRILITVMGLGLTARWIRKGL
jgi:membrane AbrB-like protein